MFKECACTCWRIPANYTAAQIVYAVRHAKSHTGDVYITPQGTKTSAAEYVLWFRRCLRDKIYARDIRAVRGRRVRQEYVLGLYRDAQRLKGYGGFGKVLETPAIRERLGADHVHMLCGGGHRLCGDRFCESRH